MSLSLREEIELGPNATQALIEGVQSAEMAMDLLDRAYNVDPSLCKSYPPHLVTD